MSASKEGITLPGETEDKCCWCIPIKIGVTVIGVFVLLSCVGVVFEGLGAMDYDSIFGILILCTCAPIVLAGIKYVQWFKDDSQETRMGCSTACMLMIVAELAVAAVYLVFALTAASVEMSWALSYIIGAGISSVIWFYYAGVCKRYAGQS